MADGPDSSMSKGSMKSVVLRPHKGCMENTARHFYGMRVRSNVHPMGHVCHCLFRPTRICSRLPHSFREQSLGALQFGPSRFAEPTPPSIDEIGQHAHTRLWSFWGDSLGS